MALTRRSRTFAVLAAATLVCAVSIPAMSAAAADETPAPDATSAPEAVGTPSPEPSPGSSPEATPTPSATVDPSASATPDPSASATVDPSATPSPTATEPTDETSMVEFTLCHATGDELSPFLSVTMDVASVTADGPDSHQHADDIVPAVGDYPGRNLDTRYARGVTGAEVLANGCLVSPADRVNEGPVVVVDALEVIGDAGDLLTISGSFADPDGDDLVLTADNEVGDFTDNGDGTWTFEVQTTSEMLTGTVTVTATDPDEKTATDEFTYVINHRPVIETYAMPADVNEGQQVVLGGSFFDLDGDPLVITTDATSGSFSDNGDGTWYWILDTNAGTPDGTITVTASDGRLQSASDTVSYRVNKAPVVSTPAISVEATAGETVRITGAFTDPDGDPLILMADNELVTFTDNGNGSWSYEIITDGFTPTDMVIHVKARDTHGQSATDTFRIQLSPAAPA